MQLGSTIATLRSARRNPMVAGVVLHVNSPGGSALASDLIHREVLRLKELKPVVACFGDVAASGGYYVSASADAVVAQPMTITGSIGVVSARLITEPLMERFGV
ncbi:MAG TPA: signal peptide peptidase SppA, partial [Myxococcales bacterium]|nr:signal peptide peptidase SppA [Myxococcales bacterium]